MKFLLDANLSPQLLSQLNASDCSTQHVSELGLIRASDIEILKFAKRHRAVVITADVDFGELLMKLGLRKPSVITVRRVERLSISELAALLISTITANRKPLSRGMLIVVEPGNIRQRALPLQDQTKR